MALSFVLLAACNARLGAPIGDHLATDADAEVDAPAVVHDASIDARACTGGDAHSMDVDGNCYLFFTGPKTYNGAKTACTALSAHLVKITTASQNAIVATLTLGTDSFIGATDAVTEGAFLWYDDTPLTFTMFHAGEPNNGAGMYQEDCLVMAGARTPANTWDDRPCTTGLAPMSGSYAYTCEY